MFDPRRPSALMRKSRVSNGSTRSRGTALKTSSKKIQVCSPTGSARHPPGIMHHGPSSPASEPAWKVLVLSSWLLLGRPTTRSPESNCTHFLEARLDLFWSEDWPALWSMVPAVCNVAPISRSTTKSGAEHRQPCVRKFATLARTGVTRFVLTDLRRLPTSMDWHLWVKPQCLPDALAIGELRVG